MTSRSLLLGLLAGLLCSCGSISNIAELSKNKLKNLRSSNTPPIVEVKKDSLKEIKSGEQQILAYNNTLKKRNSSRKTPAVGEFFAPDDFDAGALPTGGNFPSLGLLPPLNPGGTSSIETEESIENLTTEPKAPEEEPKMPPGTFSTQ